MTFPSCTGDLGQTDTVVRRLEPAVVPGIPSSDMIRTRIEGMSLTSVAPITVTYGGANPTQFDVSVTISQMMPAHG